MKTKEKEIKKENNNKWYIKLIIYLIIIALLIISIIFSINTFLNEFKYKFKLTENNITVSLNTTIDPNSYIKEIKKASVTYNNVDTTTIGEKKITYVVTDYLLKKKHLYYLNINVIDDIAPQIQAKDNITIYTGSKIDLKTYIKATDNYDKELDINIDGKVDTEKEGTYKVKYIVSDKSNNKVEKTITFTVKKKTIYTPVVIENGVKGTTSKGYKIENKGGATYVGGILVANKTYNLSSSYGGGLTSATKNSFNEMKKDAEAAGYTLRIGSGYRSFNSQKSIYKNYVKRDGQAKADTYSARPGHSEHQTGLAIDICANGYKCIGSGFDGTPPANWLSDNAYKYGFILRYPSGKSGETGYKFESWHYRYVGKELAEKLYNGGNWITLESYLGITSKYSD